MQLIHAWKDIITFFYPSNIKFFLLITVNSILQAYKIIMKYWWWLIVIIGGLNVLWWQNTRFFLLISVLLYYLFIFVFFLSTRPSIEKKDMAYFCSYLLLFFPAMAGFLGIQLIGTSVIKFIGPLGNWQSIYLFIKTFTYATQVFFLFFFLDSTHSIKQFLLSFVRAIKMTIYNYPICLIFGLSIIGIEIVFSFIVGRWLFTWKEIDLLLRAISLINIFVFSPLQLSIFTNMYIKKLHEQFDYYFNK